jgi:hypothetical protein
VENILLPSLDRARSASASPVSFMSDKGEGDGEDEDVSNAEPRRIKLSPSRASSIVAIKSKTWIAYYPTHPPSNPSPPQTHHHGSGKHATPPLSLDAGEEVAQRLLHVAALRSPHLVHFNTAGHSADRDHPTPSSSTSSAFSSSSSRPHLADDDSFEGDRTLTHIRKLSFGSFPP